MTDRPLSIIIPCQNCHAPNQAVGEDCEYCGDIMITGVRIHLEIDSVEHTYESVTNVMREFQERDGTVFISFGAKYDSGSSGGRSEVSEEKDRAARETNSYSKSPYSN